MRTRPGQVIVSWARKQDLEQLHATGSKGGNGTRQVQTPGAYEYFIIILLHQIAMLIKKGRLANGSCGVAVVLLF